MAYLIDFFMTAYFVMVVSLFYKKFYPQFEPIIQKIVDSIREKEIENDVSDNDSEKSEEIQKNEITYEEKYLKRFKQFPITELTQEQLDNLKNSILLEKTPVGNVIMFYDSKRESFLYYSDSTIPYRFLESICRKYVMNFNCKKLFVDMEEEIHLAKEKLGKKEPENVVVTAARKTVYAKFKSYNKDTSKDVASAAPKKSSKSRDANNCEPAILKENANRYTHEGRFSNFSFLKKVVDKRMAITFAEFKKIQEDKNKNLE